MGSKGLSLEKRNKERQGAWVGRTQESLDPVCPPIYVCAEGEEAVHTDVCGLRTPHPRPASSRVGLTREGL